MRETKFYSWIIGIGCGLLAAVFVYIMVLYRLSM